MSSRGTTLRPIRVPPDLYEAILREIARTNPNRADEAFSFSSWMLTAAREKLDKARRGRINYARRKRQQRKGQVEDLGELDQVEDLGEDLGGNVESHSGLDLVELRAGGDDR